jgi:hypothetical protein
MTAVNLYKHSTRSYWDAYNAFVAAYPRKPTWMFKEMSGMIDHQSEVMNRIATDILYPVTRESAYAFAASCDYDPAEADGATDTLTITLNSAMAKTLPIGYQVGGISTTTGKMVTYELTAVGNSSGTDTISVAAKQQKTYSNKVLFSIDSDEDFSDYPVDGYTNIIKSSMSLVIDSQTWTRVDYFDNSSSTDKHFIMIYQSSGKVRIGFGDGTTGAKPTLGSTVYGTFATTFGVTGQMNAGEITINIGNDSDISTITNAGSAGGNDAETISSIIRNARGSVRLRGMVWSQEDLEVAARSSSSTIQKALGLPAIGAASIHIIIAGGDAPGAPLLDSTAAYVQTLTQFGSMPITVLAATTVPVNITATVTVRSGFVTATVQNLTEFALTMATCCFDNQIIEYYQDNGIDACRTALINVYWAWAFTEEDNTALEYILDKWIALLGVREYREWGQDLEVGDLWIMGNSLYDYGLDIFSLTSPTANVTVTSSEIISSGTVAVS